MYKVNEGWNKFVLAIINNIGWILVVILSVLTLLFTQLTTQHSLSNLNIHGLVASYREYGKIHGVVVQDIGNVPLENQITISVYYAGQLTQDGHEGIITYLTKQRDQKNDELVNLLPTSAAYVQKQAEIMALTNSINQYNAEYEIIVSGVLRDINGITVIAKNGQLFSCIGEYTYDKFIYLAVNDFYSWAMALLLTVSAIVIKIQGKRTGRNSGLKIVWKTTARHATLSEKLAPRAKEAEKLCQEMNATQLKLKREEKLRYVALKYEDVFDEHGTFLNNPNFVKVSTITYKKNGKTIVSENPYQKRLLKKQETLVEELKTYQIKEVHIFILLESKAEAKERFDFGESIKKHEVKTNISNVVTSLGTLLPLFGAVSLFVVTKNPTNLTVGIIGIALNMVALLFNMFGEYDYILNVWAPGVVKKCDTLLLIANELGVADEKDNNWDATIERELLESNKNTNKTLHKVEAKK